jgi:hypothetical protein
MSSAKIKVPEKKLCQMTNSDFPFEVPIDPMMVARIPGKMPGTVLTIELGFYNATIYEYTDPLFRGRQWSYETAGEALNALALYISTPGYEPDNWIRAIDFEGGYRMRRASVIDGERVITVDKDED